MADPHEDATLLRIGRVLRKTAHRLGELVAYSDTEVSYLTREHATFKIAGVHVSDPSAEQLDMMGKGDVVHLAPCSTKPDQFGEATCSFPSVLEHDGTGTCAAAAIVAIEKECPCRGADRRTRPLFARRDGRPYSYGQLNAMLHRLVSAIFGPALASVISFHSFRIALACELRAAGCPDAIIQLLCRWQCAESLREYAQLSTSSHTEWLTKADTVDYDAVRVSNLPALDNSDALADLERPSAQQRARARSVVQASDAAKPPQPPITAPLLAKGDRVSVLWGDQWWAGSFTSSRKELKADGAPSGRRAHRVLYDAAEGWPATAYWHILEEEQWRHQPPPAAN